MSEYIETLNRIKSKAKTVLTSVIFLFALSGCTSGSVWSDHGFPADQNIGLHSWWFQTINSVVSFFDTSGIANNFSSNIQSIVDTIKNIFLNSSYLSALIQAVMILAVAYIIIRTGIAVFSSYMAASDNRPRISVFELLKRAFTALVTAVLGPTVIISLFVVTITLSSSAASWIVVGTATPTVDQNQITVSTYQSAKKNYNIDFTTWCARENSWQNNNITNDLSNPNVTIKILSDDSSVCPYTYCAQLYKDYCTSNDGTISYSRVGEKMENDPAVRDQWVFKNYFNSSYATEEDTTEGHFSLLCSIIVFVGEIILILNLAGRVVDIVSCILFLWVFCGNYVNAEEMTSMSPLVKKLSGAYLSIFYIICMFGVFIATYIAFGADTCKLGFFEPLMLVALVVTMLKGSSMVGDLVTRSSTRIG